MPSFGDVAVGVVTVVTVVRGWGYRGGVGRLQLFHTSYYRFARRSNYIYAALITWYNYAEKSQRDNNM